MQINKDNFTRDENGLLKNVEYKFNDDGTINWRAMVLNEHIVVNKQRFERFGKKAPESIEGLKDNELLLLLASFKYLARIRGFYYVRYPQVISSPEHCTAVCQIHWISNYESGGEDFITSGVGDATLNNTSGFGQYYLAPIAENRAFVRCVRNALGIEVLGFDEIGQTPDLNQVKTKNSQVEKTKDKLKKKMDKMGYTVSEIAQKLVLSGDLEAKSYESLDDLTPGAVVKALNLLSE